MWFTGRTRSNQDLRFRVDPLNGRCTGDVVGDPNAQREVIATRSGSGNPDGAQAEVTLAVQVLPVDALIPTVDARTPAALTSFPEGDPRVYYLADDCLVHELGRGGGHWYHKE